MAIKADLEKPRMLVEEKLQVRGSGQSYQCYKKVKQEKSAYLIYKNTNDFGDGSF